MRQLVVALAVLVCVTEANLLQRVSSNLLLYYPFREGSGSTFANQAAAYGGVAVTGTWDGQISSSTTWLSGSAGIHITSGANGAPAWVPNTFEQLDAYFQANTPSYGKTGFSLEMWVATDDLTQSALPIVGAFAATGSTCTVKQLFSLQQSAANGKFSLTESDTAAFCQDVPSTSRLFNNTGPTHIVVTVPVLDHAGTSTSNIRIYVNGTLASSASSPTLASDFDNSGAWSGKNAWLQLGSSGERTGVPASLWRGKFYQLALYGAPLTAAQIQQNLMVGPYNIPPVVVPTTVSVNEAGATETQLIVTLTATDSNPTDTAFTYRVMYTSSASTLYQVNADGSRGAVIARSTWVILTSTTGRVAFVAPPYAYGNPNPYDSFQFQASDGQDTSNTATVTVNVINTPQQPTVTMQSGAVTGSPYGSPFSIGTVTVNDNDGGSLRVLLSVRAGSLTLPAWDGTTALVSGVSGYDGAITLSGPIATLNTILASVTYTARTPSGAATSTSDTFTVTVSDGVTTPVTQTLSISSPAGSVTLASGATVSAVFGVPTSAAGFSLTYADASFVFMATVSCGACQLSVPTVTGVVAVGGTTSSLGGLTLAGSSANLNSALSGLQYSAAVLGMTSDSINLVVRPVNLMASQPSGSRSVAVTIAQGGIAPALSITSGTTLLAGNGYAFAGTLTAVTAVGAGRSVTLYVSAPGLVVGRAGVPNDVTILAGENQKDSVVVVKGPAGSINSLLSNGLSFTANSAGAIPSSSNVVVTVEDPDTVNGTRSASASVSVAVSRPRYTITAPTLLNVNALAASPITGVSVAAQAVGSFTADQVGAVNVRVDLAASGVMAVPSLSGIRFLSNAGSPGTSISFTSTLSVANNALASLTYTGAAVGSDAISIRVYGATIDALNNDVDSKTLVLQVTQGAFNCTLLCPPSTTSVTTSTCATTSGEGTTTSSGAATTTGVDEILTSGTTSASSSKFSGDSKIAVIVLCVIVLVLLLVALVLFVKYRSAGAPPSTEKPKAAKPASKAAPAAKAAPAVPSAQAAPASLYNAPSGSAVTVGAGVGGPAASGSASTAANANPPTTAAGSASGNPV